MGREQDLRHFGVLVDSWYVLKTTAHAAEKGNKGNDPYQSDSANRSLGFCAGDGHKHKQRGIKPSSFPLGIH